MTTVEVLEAARALIEQPEDWCRGALELPNGQRCARGAILKAAPTPVTALCVEVALRKVIERAAPRRHITLFNDDPKTSHADVLAAFDRAIQAEKGRS